MYAMDWPVATVILGLLGTVTAAFVKIVPQRTIVENSKGEPCATKEDVRALHQAFNEHTKYVEIRNHDIIRAIGESGAAIQVEIEPVKDKLTTLLERTRHYRGSRDQTD